MDGMYNKEDFTQQHDKCGARSGSPQIQSFRGFSDN